jgi:transcriptional regulator GlxA family with amidase domain
VVVPALNAKQPTQLLDAPARRDVCEAKDHLRARHAEGIGIAAACVGTFMVADMGLLDQGRR